MASKKELLGIVLDVGPHMHKHLEQAGRCLFNAVLSKMWYQPNHEVAVVCFGTAETRNAVFEEMGGEGTQYRHITVLHPLQTTNLQYLTTFLNVERGPAVGDFVDAVVVALDLMLKAVNERGLGAFSKRIVAVSNFVGQIGELEADFRADVVQQMQEAGLKLDVLCLEETPEAAGPHQSTNLEVIDTLLAEVRGDMYNYRQAYEVAQYFRARDFAAVPSKVPLSIGGTLIGVKIIKKSVKQTTPSMNLYSDKSEAPDASHKVLPDREYKLVSNPDEPVPPEEVVKAFRYGKQLVPISKNDLDDLQYEPDKGFQVLGFAPAAVIPRQHFLKDSSVVVPDVSKTEKAWAENCRALSALVRALHREAMVAIVRCKFRANSGMFLGVLTPWLGNNRRPDAFVLNHIPFSDDLRDQEFPGFEDLPEDVKPSIPQISAATAFVKALSLGGGPAGTREHLAPEKTINPTLHRFYTTMGLKALDPEAPVAENDDLVQRTFTLQLDHFRPNAPAAIEKLKAQFPVQRAERRPQTADAAAAVAEGTRFSAHADAVFTAEGTTAALGGAAQQVGTATPVEDFQSLVAAGKLQQALDEMPGVVNQLVSSSVGDRLYTKAQQCVAAARQASIDAQQPGPFNGFLADLCSKYEHHREHSAFWQHLVQAGAALIDTSACRASEISPEAAAEFIRIHSGAPGNAAAPAAAAVTTDDEFEDFE